MHGRPLVPALVLAVSALACSATDRPAPARPTPPADWVVVESGARDLRLTVPPDLLMFENSGAILMNVAPAAQGGGFVQLLAQGPGAAELQPGALTPLGDWLAERTHTTELPGVITEVELPAGRAVHLDRTWPEPAPYRLLAWAIRTDAGVTLLVIDGPAELLAPRVADAELIAQLLEIGG